MIFYLNTRTHYNQLVVSMTHIKLQKIILGLVFLLLIVESRKKHQKQTKQQDKETVPLGEFHTFSLTRYEKPEEFSFLISCQQNALINFQLSKRLKTLHKHLFLNVEFETHECFQSHQDIKRVLLNDEHWDLMIQAVCCGGENATKIFNQTITVTVRDGFKILGMPIKTKTWNIFMPVLTSLVICLFVWFSNFSQPRAINVSFLSRFYRETKPKQEAEQKHLDISIDKVQPENTEGNEQNKKKQT